MGGETWHDRAFLPALMVKVQEIMFTNEFQEEMHQKGVWKKLCWVKWKETLPPG